MPAKKQNVEISQDAWFRDAEREQEVKSRIVTLSIEELHPFKDHPFQIRDDAEMVALIGSVKSIGIKVPILVRPAKNGGYEIISGHRRAQAAIDNDMSSVPAIVDPLDDDTAIILMADSNLSQRLHILPSEKAKAIKMKYDAIVRRAGRPAKNVSQVETHLKRTDEDLASQSNTSRAQIQRFLRLTELNEPLLDSLDAGELKFTPAVELSYLKPEEQSALVCIMETDEVVPTLQQARHFKDLSQQDALTEDVIAGVLRQGKPTDFKVSLKCSEIKQYFPPDTTPKQMKKIILDELAKWHQGKDEPEAAR